MFFFYIKYGFLIGLFLFLNCLLVDGWLLVLSVIFGCFVGVFNCCIIFCYNLFICFFYLSFCNLFLILILFIRLLVVVKSCIVFGFFKELSMFFRRLLFVIFLILKFKKKNEFINNCYIILI